MLPVLPLELQLRIIELAVPPLTKRNLGKVRQLSTTLPLVCRAWMNLAYRAVPVVPRFVFNKGDRAGTAPDLTLDTIAASGRVAREVELDLGMLAGLEVFEQLSNSRLTQTPNALWLDLPDDQRGGTFLVENFDVPRLHLDDARWCASGTWLIGSLQPRVETLSLSSMQANSLDTVDPSIRRLVFTTWEGADLDLSNIWPFTPNLEILGIAVRPPYSGCFEWDVFEGSRASNTVRHVCLQFAYDRKTGRCTLFDPDLFSLALPPSLLTLTVRHPSILTSGQRSVITAACERNSTTFIEQAYTLGQGQLEDEWDIEEWALLMT
ncbi:uncharacterized protein JCM10292_005353 [Rhodotorula paludigena]|uniref:uncharacterized protein n=1 Tax=Rhodotorula paludigena TaxID=86838 RepID=UPI00317ABB38